MSANGLDEVHVVLASGPSRLWVFHELEQAQAFAAARGGQVHSEPVIDAVTGRQLLAAAGAGEPEG